MRILDRYILKSVLTIFFSCIFVFIFLYCVIDILSDLDEILKQKVDLFILIQYYISFLPIMLVQVSPFACLISTLYTFGKLNHNNEIIAMRSSGLSIFQMIKTVLVFGVLVTMVIFWVNNSLVPTAQLATQRIKKQMEAGKGKPKPQIIQNLSMYGLKNRLFFINKFDTSSNTMEGITILEHDQLQNLVKKIVANKGVYLKKEKLWKFFQSITYNFDKNSQIIQEPTYFEEEIMSISEGPADFMSQMQRPDFMTINQLEDYIWRLSKSGASTVIRNLKVELYQRYAMPFTNCIIILLGVPFALIMRRRATGLSSIGFSIMVGFLYYILNAVCLALGNGGILSPLLAASLSHIVCFTFAIYLISGLP